MRYIENGKIKLDGSIKECDLEEKLLRALEIIVDKTPMPLLYIACGLIGATKEDMELLREVIQ